jgi:hypothetical protein
MSIVDLMLILMYQFQKPDSEEPPIITDNNAVSIPIQWYIDPIEVLRDFASAHNFVFSPKQNEVLSSMLHEPWKRFLQLKAGFLKIEESIKVT